MKRFFLVVLFCVLPWQAQAQEQGESSEPALEAVAKGKEAFRKKKYKEAWESFQNAFRRTRSPMNALRVLHAFMNHKPNELGQMIQYLQDWAFLMASQPRAALHDKDHWKYLETVLQGMYTAVDKFDKFEKMRITQLEIENEGVRDEIVTVTRKLKESEDQYRSLMMEAGELEWKLKNSNNPEDWRDALEKFKNIEELQKHQKNRK